MSSEDRKEKETLCTVDGTGCAIFIVSGVHGKGDRRGEGRACYDA